MEYLSDGHLRMACFIPEAHRRLLRIARRAVRELAKPSVDPEDALQQTYLHAFACAERFVGDSAEDLVRWLGPFLHFEIQNLSRTRGYLPLVDTLPSVTKGARRMRSELSRVLSSSPGPQEEALRAERRDLVRAVLKKLESSDAQLVLAVLAEGTKASTVARELSPKRRSTVYRSIDRLRAQLRRELGELD